MRLLLACAAAALTLGATPKSSVPRIDVVLVPAGSFVMGSEAETDERPAHRVTIARPFYVGKYEVTQAQWSAVMGKGPSQFRGADLPVERVTWDEAVASAGA
jgi:formylglycine-generating enzyme required for sulfatase activity